MDQNNSWIILLFPPLHLGFPLPLPSLAPGLPAAPPASRFRAAATSALQLGFPGGTISARLAEAMTKTVIWPGEVMGCRGWLTKEKDLSSKKKRLHGLSLKPKKGWGSRVFKMVWPTVDGFNKCQININRPKCRLKLYNHPSPHKKKEPATCFLL